MIKHVIFDLDGTLVDSAPVCVNIMNAMLAERGSERTICPIEIKPFLSLGGEQMVTALLRDVCGDPKTEIVEFRKRYSAARTPETSLYAGVRAGLEKLRAHEFEISICSNKPQHLCQKVLTDLAIDRHFQLVIGGTTTRRAKPAPDMLAAVLNHHNISPRQCLYVGDSEVDHATAHALDVPFLLVTYGYGAPDLKLKSPATVDCFADAVRVILNESSEGHHAIEQQEKTAVSAVA
jgi:phosphoglycolate phosphatase